MVLFHFYKLVFLFAWGSYLCDTPFPLHPHCVPLNKIFEENKKNKIRPFKLKFDLFPNEPLWMVEMRPIENVCPLILVLASLSSLDWKSLLRIRLLTFQILNGFLPLIFETNEVGQNCTDKNKSCSCCTMILLVMYTYDDFTRYVYIDIWGCLSLFIFT